MIHYSCAASPEPPTAQDHRQALSPAATHPERALASAEDAIATQSVSTAADTPPIVLARSGESLETRVGNPDSAEGTNGSAGSQECRCYFSWCSYLSADVYLPDLRSGYDSHGDPEKADWIDADTPTVDQNESSESGGAIGGRLSRLCLSAVIVDLYTIHSRDH